MRTTLTLDDDVAAELERLRKTRDLGRKRLVNEALRLGFRQMAEAPKPKKPFRTKSFHTGGVLVKSIDNVAELLAEIEGETFR